MRRIVTVTGEIKPEELGFCHSHEHLSIAKGHCYTIDPAICIDNTALTLLELQSFRQAGGRAIIDAQPVGCGREALVLEALAKQSGIHIVASTGFHRMLYYPENHWIFTCQQAALAQVFIDELTAGMYVCCDLMKPRLRCESRAGFIKAALDGGEMNDRHRKLFTAAALAQTLTGAALMVHIERDSDPIMLADFLENQKVNLNAVIFCHMDRMIPDLNVHKELCARGIYMEYDTIARFKYHSDEREAEIVAEMISAGYENQLLMGLDVTRRRLCSYSGEVGLGYIRNNFIPLLKQNAVSDSAIDKIFVRNPARAFSKEV